MANLATHSRVQSALLDEANVIWRQTFPKVPYNMRSNGPHMRDQYSISKPLKSKFRIQGVSYPSTKVTLKPKGKFKVYYGVVWSGQRNGKALNYTNSSSEPYAIHKITRSRNKLLQTELTELLVRLSESIDS